MKNMNLNLKELTKTTVGVAAHGNPHFEGIAPTTVGTGVFKPVRKHRGITLVSLVITIVLMLILAGVAISIAVSPDGLFGKAREATEKWNNRVAKEEQIMADIMAEVNNINNKENIPNRPKLVDGMTPIKFTLPEGETAGTTITTTAGDEGWYNYEEKKWANAKTEDGSMWVWIPRYAYKINESTKTTEVVFLRGTSDTYYDEEGNQKTAQRAKTATDVIDTTSDFTVHPAFTNESGIGYRNGGWDKELTGIWVAKFEAGYPTGNNTAPVVASNVEYSQTKVTARAVEAGTESNSSITARNWLDGIYGDKAEMPAIKYPTFQPLTYSMNYINHSDAYLLARDMTSENNIYGFTSSADTHLMKDSEWGAIAYLSKSQYGLQGADITINNVSMNSGGSATTKAEGNNYASVYGITGVTRRIL